jgi:Icc-related predicted phosphoesterase
MIPDDDQDKIYDEEVKTGKKIDILMSHDAPYGVSDVLLQKDCPWATGEHIGNKPLARFIEQVVPKINLHGHLHSTNHEKEMYGDTEVYNVSLLDENYRMVYNPQYFEI